MAINLRHTHTLSGKGERPNQFLVRLAGTAVDSQGCVLAVGDREVKRFWPDGRLDVRFSTRDAGWSVAADEGSIWVGMQGAIERFDESGNFQDKVEDTGRLGLVTGLAVLGGTLIAADATNRTIRVYRDGIWQCDADPEVNTRGFMIPNGVLDVAAESERNSFLVAHPQKHRVERYSADGALVNTFGRFGMDHPADFGGCCNPTNVTANPEGLIVVSEKAPPRLKVYTSDGDYLTQSPAGIFDPNTKNIDLAAGPRGRLYATDPLRCTIAVFELEAAGG
jgi:sugar lactone lactonase YvrE